MISTNKKLFNWLLDCLICSAATDVDAWEDVPSAPCFYQCFLLFVCFEGMYAGHPYIQLITFEIILLAFNVIIDNLTFYLQIVSWIYVISNIRNIESVIKCSTSINF